MRSAVENFFLSFTEEHEGGPRHGIRYMLRDSAGRVATGFGIDFDTDDPSNSADRARAAREGIPKAQALEWRLKTGQKRYPPGSIVDAKLIANEWNLTNSLLPNQVWTYYEPHAALELTDAALEKEVFRRLRSNEAVLKSSRYFSDFEQWPADAQLGLLSMAWSGPGVILNQFPRFCAFCKDKKFSEAAKECRLGPEVGSIKKRNDANQRLFRNAAAVLEGEKDMLFDRSTLYYPTILEVIVGV